MINIRFAVAALLIWAAGSFPPALLPGNQIQLPSAPVDVRAQAAIDDFTRRVHAYMEVRWEAALTVPALRVTANPAEIREAVDALASAIQTARPGARPGDIFSPEITAVIRLAIATGCEEQYIELLALVNEDLTSPLPAPTIYGRWPEGAPLPTMPPNVLAALPRLPAELEYRFMNRDLVLRDVDANLILDYVPNAIPLVTSAP